MEVRDTFPHALPKTTPLQLDTWHLDDAQAQITRLVASTQAKARCPAYETPARHIHSRDGRTLADLPWSGDRVAWRLRVRQFFCRNASCAGRIFTERLPGLAALSARRTLRLMARLLAIGLALGGAAGVRLRQFLGLTVSRNTLLRVIRRAPCPAMVAPAVLSVDEFARRKRHTYGILLLDLARRRPMALLPDREAATVAQWLQAHPGVEVLVRDRAEVYAEAARLGAAEAFQVADRFHPLHNLADVLTDVFRAHAPHLARLHTQYSRAPTPVHDPASPVTVPRLSTVPLAPPQPSTRAVALAATRRAQRVACYQ
jgi:transposase